MRPSTGILDLHVEARRGPDAADRRHGAAEHRDAGRQALVAVVPAADQIARRADLGREAFLVGDLLAAFLDEAAQDQLVPVRLDLLEAPGRAADHLGADLLGLRRRRRLSSLRSVWSAPTVTHSRSAVPNSTGSASPDVSSPTTWMAVGLRQQARGDAVVQRHLRGRLHADRLQLLDVMVQRRDIAAGPAGDHQVIDVEGCRPCELDQRAIQRTASCEFRRSVTSM